MIKVYIIGALVAVAILFTWHYRSTIEQNKDLKAVKEVDTATINALDNNATTQREIETTEKERRNEIRKAPATDNGSISPVLRRTLARGM